MMLSELKGVGGATLKKLEKLGIFDIESLISHFPYRYIDRRREIKVADIFLMEDENYHCIATISNLKKIRLFKFRGRDLVTATLTDDTGSINVTWFNNPYITSNFQNGNTVIFSGKVEKKKLINPKIKKLNSAEDQKKFASYEPTYPETKGLKSYQINNLIKQVILDSKFSPTETLPKKIINSESLLDINEAYKFIHFPENDNQIQKARERFAFEEIYKILIKISKRKVELKKFKADRIRLNQDLHNQLLTTLNFNLTESQVNAIKEIYADISKSEPMHRLLNGDVGSGKTIVASFAASQVLENNLQVILMAPTSVLAYQHYKVIRNFFDQSDVKVHLITANTKKEINNLKKELKDNNQKEIFIGTHALLYHLELFRDVGLMIVDEQHKFGVKQRELLENLEKIKIANQKFIPHSLSMSATPIPRSLALTLYGDLNVSVILKPNERKSVITKCLYDQEMLKKMYVWVGEQIKKGNQAYVVCPLIEESELSDTKSAIKEFENIQNIFPHFKIGLLHGKIKAKDKDDVLEKFQKKEIDILVSTSVIEVGIDNPNATIMIIEGAERFGLAQLHQIRGRVGRSEKQSYCFLKTTNNEFDKRLEFFSENNDGFKIAEFDLLNRGPGEVYGEMQSGIPGLKIANILDLELVNRVKKWFK